MTEIFTSGFTGKTAEQFFGQLTQAGIRRLIDIRLRNNSQLAGFTKKTDLAFFLRAIADIEYVHEPLLAPNDELLDGYRKNRWPWEKYEESFLRLMAERRIEKHFDRSFFAGPAVLLCSEPTAEQCHRRLVVEYLARQWGDVTANHL